MIQRFAVNEFDESVTSNWLNCALCRNIKRDLFSVQIGNFLLFSLNDKTVTNDSADGQRTWADIETTKYFYFFFSYTLLLKLFLLLKTLAAERDINTLF